MRVANRSALTSDNINLGASSIRFENQEQSTNSGIISENRLLDLMDAREGTPTKVGDRIEGIV